MSLQAKYTEEQRATALCFYDACGRNLREAARKADVPHTTLDRWVKGGATNAAVSAKRDALKGELADIFEQVARESLGLARQKADAASYAQLMMGAAIGIDKALLLREVKREDEELNAHSGPGAAPPGAAERIVRVEYYDDTTSTASHGAASD